MEWVSQNWIWIALGFGALVFATRMGGMGGCGMGHSGGHRHHDDGRDTAPPAAGNRPGSLFDPVSGRSFVAGNAPVSTIYRRRAYYFETRENRNAFEREPEKYTAASPMREQITGSADERRERPRRRHGC